MSDQLTLIHYKIPFRSPFRTAKGDFRIREGFILDDGWNFRTEVAPLPGFSEESLDEVTYFLQKNNQAIWHHFDRSTLEAFLADKSTVTSLFRMPSVRFGLSMLAEQQMAVDAGLPLYAWWIRRYTPTSAKDDNIISSQRASGSSYRSIRSDLSHRTIPPVRSNAVIGLHDPATLLHAIARHKRAGYTTIKVKLPSEWQQAFSLITEVCREYPRLKFRFDANGAFTESDAHRLLRLLEAEHHASGIAGNIDYLEEPLDRSNMAALARLRQYDIRIAVDESVRTPDDLQNLLDHDAADVLVLKPMLFGTMSEMETVWAAAGDRIAVTVSSSLESVVGRTLLAHLSAFVNSLWPTDHGIATGDLFDADLPYDERAGHPGPTITLPPDYGIGLRPNFHFSDIRHTKSADSDSWKSGGIELKAIPLDFSHQK